MAGDSEGFGFIFRFNFCSGGLQRSPHTATSYTAGRYKQAEDKHTRQRKL